MKKTDIEKMNEQVKNILPDIFTTLFEENIGLFGRRNISISTNEKVLLNKESIGTINEIINNGLASDLNNPNKTYNGYELKIKELTIYIILDVKKVYKIIPEFSNLEFAKNYENNNIMIISLDELNKTTQEIPIYYYYKDLLFNLTKNKYVPHIEQNINEVITVSTQKDIDDKNLPKIKRSDKLIKFYGFPKNTICKITCKTNRMNDIDLYCNYRIVI
tara:strand:- start:863 stop:1516 length:654 start_codon:yes stop_codon:yes gene_type:complete